MPNKIITEEKQKKLQDNLRTIASSMEQSRAAAASAYRIIVALPDAPDHDDGGDTHQPPQPPTTPPNAGDWPTLDTSDYSHLFDDTGFEPSSDHAWNGGHPFPGKVILQGNDTERLSFHSRSVNVVGDQSGTLMLRRTSHRHNPTHIAVQHADGVTPDIDLILDDVRIHDATGDNERDQGVLLRSIGYLAVRNSVIQGLTRGGDTVWAHAIYTRGEEWLCFLDDCVIKNIEGFTKLVGQHAVVRNTNFIRCGGGLVFGRPARQRDTRLTTFSVENCTFMNLEDIPVLGMDTEWAIYTQGASGVIKNCRVMDNRATGRRGGRAVMISNDDSFEGTPAGSVVIDGLEHNVQDMLYISGRRDKDLYTPRVRVRNITGNRKVIVHGNAEPEFDEATGEPPLDIERR